MRRAVRRLALAACAAALAPGLRAQDETPAAPDAPEAPAAHAARTGPAGVDTASGDAQETAAARLGPDEAARIDGKLVLSMQDLDRYLGTVYARLPEGAAALDGLVGEALIAAAAGREGIAASDADVDAALAGLDAQLRAASGGERGLADSLEAHVDEAQLRATLHLQVLHERLVRRHLGLPDDEPVPVAELTAWLDAARAQAQVEEPPLDDPLAARWEVGSVSKAEVGRRLRAMLPEKDVAGVLTEMIGVLLVRRASAEAGLALTAAEATREVLERDALLRTRPGMANVSYEQLVQAVKKRSLEEVLTSDKFGAEVLLRLLTERRHGDEQARALWEADPAAWPGPDGTAETWEAARPAVRQALRERLYRELFAESTIIRRF